MTHTGAKGRDPKHLLRAKYKCGHDVDLVWHCGLNMSEAPICQITKSRNTPGGGPGSTQWRHVSLCSLLEMSPCLAIVCTPTNHRRSACSLCFSLFTSAWPEMQPPCCCSIGAFMLHPHAGSMPTPPTPQHISFEWPPAWPSMQPAQPLGDLEVSKLIYLTATTTIYRK